MNVKFLNYLSFFLLLQKYIFYINLQGFQITQNKVPQIIIDVNSMKKLKALLQVLKTTSFKILSSRQILILPLLAVVIVLRKMSFANSRSQQIVRVSLSELLNKVSRGLVSKAIVKQNHIFFLDKNNALYKTAHNLFPKSELFSKLIQGKVQFQDVSSGFNFNRFLFVIFISAAITFLWTYFFNGNFFVRKVGQIKKPLSTFKDVVGLEDCKISLKQVIEFMKNPSAFKDYGARMRKGIVFYGPSGTGKTSLAKACAGQAGVPFYSCNAAEFREMYVGMGAKKVRQLFKTARQNAPSIIYIDQIDAMGNRNGGILNNFDGAASQKNTTINQLLSEMDGFNSSEMVLVIGSTNKLQLLDQALLRPGRFDLKLKVTLPNEKDRYQIFIHYLENKKHKLSEKYIKELTRRLGGWSGADLQNLANQAVYISMRRKSIQIDEIDIENTLKVLA